MAKFTRQNLTRGVKLVRQAFITPLQAIATALSNGAINKEHLAQPMAPFRVNLNVPAVDSDLFDAWAKPGDTSLCIPFVLPPLQESFSPTGDLAPTTPIPVLDEFSFSFDQRAEPSVITDRFAAGGGEGRLDFDADVTTYDMRIALVEKRQEFFDAAAPTVPEREVFAVNIPATAFIGKTDRLNPFVVGNLNRMINPYRTYMLVLECPALSAGGTTHALVNLEFSFKFKYPLLARDTGADVQNIPTGNGTASHTSYTITNPAAGAIISENIVHGNPKVLDSALQATLTGGWNQDSSTPKFEQLGNEAAYTVWAIPVFNNYGNRRLTSATALLTAQEGALSPWDQPVEDVRRYPISKPFVIHHAFACVNYCAPATVTWAIGHHPGSATLSHEVGIAAMSGVRGERYTYTDIAHTIFTPEVGVAPKSAITVDKISASANQLMTNNTGSPVTDNYNWDVLNIPLVVKGASVGTGYFTQGKPFFIGRSHSGTRARRNVGDILGGNGQPPTAGDETYLEVRWKIEDTVGLGDTTIGPPPGAAPTNSDTYVGYNGHWVILIGKTPLSGSGWDYNKVGIPV